MPHLAAFPEPLLLVLALLVAGACTVGLVRNLRRIALEPGDLREQLAVVIHGARGLRCLLVGGAAAAIALGVVLDAASLVGLALVIGLEELYETTLVLAVLRWEARRQAAEAAAPRAVLRPGPA